MPKSWHDRWAAGVIDDESQRDLYRRIVVGRKPYFMRYVYPSLMKQYNTYIRNTDKNCLREFGMTVAELKNIPDHKRTEDQALFLKYYDIYMPVGMNDCVMNRICRKIEETFDGSLSAPKASQFDYSMLRGDVEYTNGQFSAIKRLYDEYGNRMTSYTMFAEREKIDKADVNIYLGMLRDDFERGCASVCPDENALCNIVLDLCYTRSSSKQFAWDMCGDQIIENLLMKSGRKISFPVLDQDGDIEYAGNRFSMMTKDVEVDHVDRS